MRPYISRITDQQIEEALSFAGAVVVDGTRAVGKTESARRFAASELRLDSSDPLAVLSREQPQLALAGDVPRLLDEWQLVPDIWNAVRRAVDDRGEVGQFLLSGSAVPEDNQVRHSGAGRFVHVRMRTMSFAETGHSSGDVSLGKLLLGEEPELVSSDTALEDVIERLCIGGWPGWFDLSASQAQARTLAYIESIVQHDFPQIGGSGRDPRRFTAFMRALASLVAQPSSMAAIQRRINETEHVSAGEQLIPVLMDIAIRMFLVEEQPAWSPKLRSRTTPMQTPKRHLADTSLVAALLGATTDRLLAERETLGHLFESQVMHDFLVYAQHIGARGVYHYRDVKGRDEIDIVVEGRGGEWLAIEVKLGQGAVDAAAQQLLRVTAKMERPPIACVVVVPTGVAHRRSDGVLVIPHTVLGP